jgi:membrane associated rhomboid family serine protease
MSGGVQPIVWFLAGVFVAVEALLTLGDIGVLAPDLRWRMYELFAFWDIYFDARMSGQEVSNQLYWSFVTHAFFHGGALHLLMNTAVFVALGSHLGRAVGENAMLALFFGSAIGGALAFGLIADTGNSFVPMVGASGGLFGFLGAIKRWEWRYVSTHKLPKQRFWRTMGALALINVLLSIGFGGGPGVAWEAHLGGFVCGWAMAGLSHPRRGYAIGPI